MIIPTRAIPRRTVLRGVGATLALPLLERMVPTTALARAAAEPVVRFCTVYVPNGIVMDRWTPLTEGTGFAFTPTLLPLEPFRDHLLVLSGLDNTGARSRSGASGAHAKPAGAFMTGIEPLPTTGSSSLSLGISMDQIIANTLGIAVDIPADGDFGAAFGAARLGLIAAEDADPLAVCTPPAWSFVTCRCAPRTGAWARRSTPTCASTARARPTASRCTACAGCARKWRPDTRTWCTTSPSSG